VTSDTEVPGIARYRRNFSSAKYGMSAVFRLIPSTVLTVDELGLPPVFEKISHAQKGFGSRNRSDWIGKVHHPGGDVDYANISGRIISSQSKDRSNSCIAVRTALSSTAEVGVHTKSFAAALRGAFREDRTSCSWAKCATWRRSSWH